MANTVFDDILGELRMGDTASGGSGGASLVGGYRTSIAGGTASFVPSADIVTVTGASVTLNPDTAYKIYATTSAVTLNANVPAAGKWAYEGHLEIFVAGTGYVVTGTNVVLANALEPDSVNNCTVRFHDGLAIISVEDHIAGYVVVSATGTTAGTLPYALTSSTQEYVAFDASLNGATVSLSGSTANGEKHLVGNGYTSTTLTGAVDCGTSKITVANLALSNVQITGGVMTLGDAYIPSSSTVEVTGGTGCTLSIERVSGDGVINRGNGNIQIEKNGVISGVTLNLNASNAAAVQSAGLIAFHGATVTNGTGGYGVIQIPWQGFPHVSAFDCVFSGNSANNGGAFGFTFNQEHFFTSCSFVNNSATNGGAFVGSSAAIINLSACKFSGNVSPTANAIYLNNQAKVVMTDCSFGADQSIRAYASATKVEMLGSNTMVSGAAIYGSGSAVISSGATLDLTGNTNATPIAPGGGIVFESGGATVLYSSGAVSGSYMMDNVTLPAGAKLTNTAVVDLGGGNISVVKTTTISGATLTGGVAAGGGALMISGTVGSANLTSCIITGNSATIAGGICAYKPATISDCIISGNTTGSYGGDLLIDRGTSVTIIGGTYGKVMMYRNNPTLVLSKNCSFNNLARLDAQYSATYIISSGANIANMSGSVPVGMVAGVTGGIQVVGGTVTYNGGVIEPGNYTSITSDGQGIA